MKKFSFIDWIALILVIIGGLNWGVVGLFDINLVNLIFGEMTILSRVIYIVVGLASLYTIYFLAKAAKIGRG
ncbi:MAG: hypothetical protein AMJ43_05120 [Coxiella sp. DG_40]|nr:MAG: hypothetical protein AMJ43_05120 [Coxiella sp. DG_40]